MLKFRVKGRMGNQMFIYAFGRCLELKYPAKKVFFDDYLDLKNFHLSGRDSLLIQLTSKVIFRLKKNTKDHPRVIVMDDCREYYDLSGLEHVDNRLITGYFQSYRYMEPYRKEVLSWFTPKESHRKNFSSRLGEKFNNKRVLSVHLRRTDYTSGGYDYDFLKTNDLSLPLSYYREALEELNPNKYDHIIFLSDDIEYARKNFGNLENAVFSEENALTDLQIIMNSDACIIANSTFSWWGAWLNQKPAKKIIAPEHFLGFRAGFEFPKNILPPDWNTIPVK